MSVRGYVYGRVPYCAVNKTATDMTDLKGGDSEVRCVGSSSALNYDLFHCGCHSASFSSMRSPLKSARDVLRYVLVLSMLEGTFTLLFLLVAQIFLPQSGLM